MILYFYTWYYYSSILLLAINILGILFISSRILFFFFFVNYYYFFTMSDFLYLILQRSRVEPPPLPLPQLLINTIMSVRSNNRADLITIIMSRNFQMRGGVRRCTRWLRSPFGPCSSGKHKSQHHGRLDHLYYLTYGGYFHLVHVHLTNSFQTPANLNTQ